MAAVPARRRAVGIPMHSGMLPGDLTVPAHASGVVIFAHGSGSSRLSVRNRFVAETLNARGLATLLLDLLTPEEETVRANVFDVRLLADRLLAATEWADRTPEVGGLSPGYFGASTGAAAALWAAAEIGDDIGAVVSRGGRPDLAEERLGEVTAPTLLIVGGNDWTVLELNERAATFINADHELAIVPRATHLFEEPGALERVAELSGDWFEDHLCDDAGPRATRHEPPRSRRRRSQRLSSSEPQTTNGNGAANNSMSGSRAAVPSRSWNTGV